MQNWGALCSQNRVWYLRNNHRLNSYLGGDHYVSVSVTPKFGGVIFRNVLGFGGRSGHDGVAEVSPTKCCFKQGLVSSNR